MVFKIPKPPKVPPNLPEGFVQVVNDKPESWYWAILLIFGVIMHFSYALMTAPIEVCIGKTLGTIVASMIVIPIIRKVTKTWGYFTKKNIAIALFIGFFLYIILKNYGQTR